MRKVFISHKGRLIGVLLGVLSGYLYYRFTGCQNGTCAITSNPYTVTMYGALMGWLVSGAFKNEQKETN